MLAQLGEPLGVVTAIAGQARGFKVFEGRADHAGTTPMDARADALLEAARFILHVRDCAREGTVATVGAIEVEPNATNVVPAKVTVSVDARSADAALLDALVDEIGFELNWRSDPVPMCRRLRGRGCPTRRGSSRARGTTRWCSPPPACRRRCSSCAR